MKAPRQLFLSTLVVAASLMPATPIGGTIDGGTRRMTLAPRAAGIFLVGAAPRGFALPLWAMLLVAVAVVVVATAVIVTRARRRSLRRV